MSSIVFALLSNNSSVHTRNARQRARLIATLRRLREKRNSEVRGMSAAEEVVMVKNTTAASRPWNLSTVPDGDAPGPRIGVENPAEQCDLVVVRGDDHEVPGCQWVPTLRSC